MVVFLCKLVATISLRGGRLCGKNDSIRGSYFLLCCMAFIFASYAPLLAIVVTTPRICLKSDTGATACATGAIILFQLGLAHANDVKSTILLLIRPFCVRHIFIFCEFRVIFLYPLIGEFLAELDDYD